MAAHSNCFYSIVASYVLQQSMFTPKCLQALAS